LLRRARSIRIYYGAPRVTGCRTPRSGGTNPQAAWSGMASSVPAALETFALRRRGVSAGCAPGSARFHGPHPDFGTRHSRIPPLGGTLTRPKASRHTGDRIVAPLQGFRRWAPARLPRRPASPATGRPGSRPDRSSTSGRRAYKHKEAP
jgi:hypothetical protein